MRDEHGRRVPHEEPAQPFIPRLFGWLLVALVFCCTGRRP
jgi:hypothetical protein